MRIVLASWNVHAWVGSDLTRNPARTFEVIRGLGADAVALQEVEGLDWKYLADEAGFRTIAGPSDIRAFGNVLLVRDPVTSVRSVDLSVGGFESRSALDAIVERGGSQLRIVSTHFGLRVAERRRQAARLAQHILEYDDGVPVVLMGDLNDWTPWGSQLRPLVKALGPLSRIPTFPSRRPILPLDRAALRAPGRTALLESVRSRSARHASDHLPLRMELTHG